MTNETISNGLSGFHAFTSPSFTSATSSSQVGGDWAIQLEKQEIVMFQLDDTDHGQMIK